MQFEEKRKELSEYRIEKYIMEAII